MARFLHGLNKEIQEISTKLQRWSCNLRGSQPLRSRTLVIVGEIKREVALERTRVLRKGVKIQRGKNRRESHHHLVPLDLCLGKGHIISQCPNKRTTILRENEEVKIECSQGESTYYSEVESSNDH
ncbi:hypothetical protein CR513_05272, partial [Mucuna pruriens]